MKLKLKIKGKECEVEILEEGEDKVKIKMGEKEFIFGKEEKKGISLIQTSIPKRNFSKKEIKAPIAGVISEIFVKEGDFVKREQKILFLSTMKMENEIISDFDGKVKEILVKKNQEVKEEETLIVLE
ncbi:MAG: acetyl-CoA carboxylase biotin carboxyl carrier protein subunit [Candidatus Nealsonbacteria bacterium]|nr:MAG: acetyl-CoA carboxylase biotin carboxyl carrier protein subunit [Candidatus Nealsonbacteria bacterium]